MNKSGSSKTWYPTSNWNHIYVFLGLLVLFALSTGIVSLLYTSKINALVTQEIEKALLIFEEGTKLSRLCAKKLSRIERRVEILTRGREGEENLELFRDLDSEQG